MKPVSNETILKQLNWRYATKKFDAAKKISAEDWKTLEQGLILSPSSYGLQPWKFFVVKNPALRKQLQAASWNQSQIVDASHLVVFTAQKEVGPKEIEKFIAQISKTRGIPETALADYKGMMTSSLSKPAAEITSWTMRQVYIALGEFLVNAAMLGIDACPMEGFDAAQYNKILGLEKDGYTATVVATAGYRSAEDTYAELAKVRYSAQELITTLE